MPLDPAYRQFVERQLAECDAALADKPCLSAIFDPAWRAEHREKMLNAESPFEIWYPSTYAKSHQNMDYPEDYQQRLEEGAAILLPKLDPGAKKHLIRRMRGEGCTSAEEELLLARGFAAVFGEAAITFPTVNRAQDVPEFHVAVAGHAVEIEAKGLLDSDEVRQLNEFAIRSGQYSWCSFSPSIGDVGRLRVAVARKLLSKATGDARVLVLTQYTAWITPVEGIPLIRTLAVNPTEFGIPPDQHALAIAYVTGRRIAGVWFNAGVAARLKLTESDRESIRRAVRISFYERAGSVFFHEQQSEEDQRAMIIALIRIAHGG